MCVSKEQKKKAGNCGKFAQQSIFRCECTWNLEVMSKCFFMSVPRTWLMVMDLASVMPTLDTASICRATLTCNHCCHQAAPVA